MQAWDEQDRKNVWIPLLEQSADEFAEAGGDWERRQKAAANAFSWLVGYAHAEPALKEFLAPLNHLAAAVQDLADGAPHPLLKNYKTAPGARKHTSNERLFHGLAIAFAEMLTAAGVKENEACISVAEMLGKAGVIGRNKRSIPPHTVRKRRADASSGDHPGVRKHADEFLQLLQVLTERMFGEWPPRRSEAARMVRAIMALPWISSILNTGKDCR